MFELHHCFLLFIIADDNSSNTTVVFLYLMEGHHFQVVDVACGYGFTVFAVNDKSGHSCYGTGLNTDSQIGKFA